MPLKKKSSPKKKSQRVTAAAFKVLAYPHLSMALELGSVYTKAELETRCLGRPERIRQLHKKLQDPELFQAVPLEKSFSKKRKARTNHPLWARGPKTRGKLDESAAPRRRIAEKMAQDFLQSREKITDAMLLGSLRCWGSRDNLKRQNVRRNKPVYSDTLGLTSSRGSRNPVMTRLSKHYPNMTKLINLWFKRQKAGFPWTSISVNCFYRAARHRDKNNAGPSAIRGLGRYRGGELLIWPRDPGKCSVKVLKTEDSKEMDISKKICFFNGQQAHEVKQFQGERFSLVFFCVGNWSKAQVPLRRSAESLQFRLPSQRSLNQAKKLS
eukprot:Skav221832  [mRNA]  locus=scaffold885:313256:314230:+ [translate_table: standard]